MGENEFLLEIVDHRIDEYKEKWLVEHEVAEACRDFEENLGGFLEVFRMVSAINTRWRYLVFTGITPYVAEVDAAIKALYEKWLGAESDLQDSLMFFEDQDYAEGVTGAPKYRQYVDAARSVLANWKSPELAQAIGQHQVVLDSEQSKKFRALLG